MYVISYAGAVNDGPAAEIKTTKTTEVSEESGVEDLYEMVTANTVMELKQRIQEKTKLDAYEIKLLLRDEEIVDDQSLERIKIKNGNNNTVHLIVREKIKINVNTTTGATVGYDSVCADSVLDIKKQAQHTLGTETKHVKLIFNGTEIKDDEKLRAMKNEVGSNEIGLVARERMLVQVFMPKGDAVQLDMETTDSIFEVKKNLMRKTLMDKTLMKILFKGDEFIDDQTLQAIKIKAISNQVNLVCKERIYMDVKMMDAESVRYEMVTSDNIAELKNRI